MLFRSGRHTGGDQGDRLSGDGLSRFWKSAAVPAQGLSLIHIFKDRDDRGRGNVVASGNRAEGLVIAFEVFQDPLNGED